MPPFLSAQFKEMGKSKLEYVTRLLAEIIKNYSFFVLKQRFLNIMLPWHFFPPATKRFSQFAKKIKLLTDLVQDFRLTDLQQHIVT